MTKQDTIEHILNNKKIDGHTIVTAICQSLMNANCIGSDNAYTHSHVFAHVFLHLQVYGNQRIVYANRIILKLLECETRDNALIVLL